MDTVTLFCNRAQGVFSAPPSKSAAHRALIAAALSGGGTVHGIIGSADMEATGRCLNALGYTVERHGDTVRLTADGAQSGVADCGESGSTLRFFMPIFAALGRETVFRGCGRLPERPLTVYEDLFPAHGVCMTRLSEGGGICRLSGRLRGGRYEMAGDVSSQFVTGLLMALPLCEEDSEIVLTSPLQSVGYVDMTLAVLKDAGVEITATAHGYHVRGRQRYALPTYTVEGDWSQAAFLLTAGAIGGDITVTGLRADSVQGDRRIETILREMGACIEWTADGLRCRRAPLHAVEADVADIPDLVPVLSVAAAAAQGTSRWLHAARLRLKESDRLQTTAALLTALGVSVRETADELWITGGPLHGGTVDGANDHRIVMSAATASVVTNGAVTVSDAHSVRKSWPTFFETYIQWGGTMV